jgi:hypothetical protein
MVPCKVIPIHEARKRVARVRRSKGRRVVRTGERVSLWWNSPTTNGKALLVGMLACVMVAMIVAGAVHASVTSKAPAVAAQAGW